MAEVIKGKSYLLAVDHSPNSQYAFEEVSRMMNHETDLLYLLTVAEYVCGRVLLVCVSRLQIPFYGPAMSAVVITEVQKSAELRAEHLLGEYVQRCRLAGVCNHHT